MISRRMFIRRTVQAGVSLLGVTGAGVGYGLWEASQIRIDRQTIAVPNLPECFAGKTIAVLADLHYGPFVGLEFIRQAVRLTHQLNPDLIALVGDYVYAGKKTAVRLPPCLAVLSELRAPLGVYTVPGNHDLWRAGEIYRETVAATPLIVAERVRETTGIWVAVALCVRIKTSGGNCRTSARRSLPNHSRVRLEEEFRLRRTSIRTCCCCPLSCPAPRCK